MGLRLQQYISIYPAFRAMAEYLVFMGPFYLRGLT